MVAQQPATLLAVLVANSERTYEEIVDEFLRCARENHEKATLSVRTLQRWMKGRVHTAPRPAQRRVARLYWGYPHGHAAGTGTTGYLDHASGKPVLTHDHPRADDRSCPIWQGRHPRTIRVTTLGPPVHPRCWACAIDRARWREQQ